MGQTTQLQDIVAQKQKEHVPIGRVAFEQDGTTMIYDFSVLDIEQRESARAIYHFGIEMAKTPPDSLSKLFISGGHNITPRAFGYLLRKVLPDGSLAPFSAEAAQNDVLEFIRRLNAEKHGDRLLECQEDFFIRARVADLELIRHSRAYAAAEEGLRSQLNALVKNALQLSKKSLNAAASTFPENSGDGSSTKGATPRSSGSSRKRSRRS